MAEKYIGSTLSLEVCGGLGYYQGKLKAVNKEKQTITLTKVIHNGKPYPALEVTISAEDMLSLNILYDKDGVKLIDDPPATPKKENTTKIAEPSVESDSSPVGFQPFRLTKVDSPPPPVAFSHTETSVVEPLAHENLTLPRPIPDAPFGNLAYEQSDSRRGFFSKSVPKKHRFQRQAQQGINDRNETAFGTQLDEDSMDTEFDFEKNLALFDKQAVMSEIASSSKPDVVGQTDRKFRCDENVLKSKVCRKQIIVPASGAGDAVYTTDNGLLVPSITEELRINLLSHANQHGLTTSRQLEMIGRGATGVIISAIGGSHRLLPGNSHQTPVVVVVCGVHEQGASGANCARQLEGHGVTTCILTPPTNATSPACMLFQQETKLYALTDGKMVNSILDLPATVDLIVDTRYDLQGRLGVRAPAWMSNTSGWLSSCKASIVAIDPPSDLTPVQCPIQTRLKLCSVLPLTHLVDKGKVYLININIPMQVFSEFEIKYFPPFGSNMTIPLHPCQ